MKKIVVSLICCMFAATLSVAQEKDQKQYRLTSDSLDLQGKELDSQIVNLNKKIAGIVKDYGLLKATRLTVIPYQTIYVMGSDFIELEKHSFLKEDIISREITGILTRKIKIYTNGDAITKIESDISDRNYWSGALNLVKIVDPSPTTEGTDDITFTHIVNGKILLDNKRLGDMKNTTAFQVRNDIKREFLVPHMNYFTDSFRFIAESYNKGIKDSELGMHEFLKQTVR